MSGNGEYLNAKFLTTPGIVAVLEERGVTFHRVGDGVTWDMPDKSVEEPELHLMLKQHESALAAAIDSLAECRRCGRPIVLYEDMEGVVAEWDGHWWRRLPHRLGAV